MINLILSQIIVFARLKILKMTQKLIGDLMRNFRQGIGNFKRTTFCIRAIMGRLVANAIAYVIVSV
jgi:hypothetical protein